MENNNIDKAFKEMVEQLTNLPEDVKWNTETGWKHYSEQFLSEKSNMKKIGISMLSIAASLIIVFLAIFLLPYSNNKSVAVHNLSVEPKEVYLPDGNKIWLNTNSSIEYPAKVNLENFVISVNGEVYVEISNPTAIKYTLKAFNAIIVAEKKSSFNIKAQSDQENIDIAVATGAIKVLEEGHPEGLALILTQGNYCSVHKSQKLIFASANSNDNYLAWKTGRLVFEDQSIATVTDVLSEYFNTHIEISDHSIAYCMFSGSFEKSTLDKILNKIQSDFNLDIIYTDGNVTISGRGCQKLY